VSGITDFLKKDISFKKKPSTKADAPKAEAPKTEAPSPQAQAAAPQAETVVPAEEKQQKDAKAPKRGLSMKRGPSVSLPKPARKPRKSGGSSSGGRHKQLVGLSIGSSQLAAAVVVNNGRPKLVKAARHTLPFDIVAGGEVRDTEALANEIATFFDTADLPRKNVRLGIGSSRTGVRVFERPAVDDPKQLANAIRFRAYETLPIPMEEAMLDYQIVEEANAPDRVLLAVAYRDLVDRYAETCTAAKIELVGMDIEAFALLRAVGGEPLAAGERAEAARVAVSIGFDRTTVAVSDGRVCEFTRVLDWGGARVTGAIQQALEVDAGEAERIKRSLDVSANAPAEPGDEQTLRAAEAARREVNGLAREPASSLHF
jgi:type IV pilus assembly protein PilM